jgi:hypothetical protein
MEIEPRAVTARHDKREAKLTKFDLSVYVNLMHKYLTNEIEIVDFQTMFLRIFKNDKNMYTGDTYETLNRIFFLFEDLNIDENRDEDDLSPEEFTRHIKEEYDRIVTK